MGILRTKHSVDAPGVFKDRILVLVSSGFGLLIVLCLVTSCLILLLQLRSNVPEGEAIAAAASNVRDSGSLSVQSDGPGLGETFTIELPIAQEAKQE